MYFYCYNYAFLLLQLCILLLMMYFYCYNYVFLLLQLCIFVTNYVLLLLCLCIFIVRFTYSYCYVCSILCILFQCVVLCIVLCVKYYCHRVSTQSQLTNTGGPPYPRIQYSRFQLSAVYRGLKKKKLEN